MQSSASHYREFHLLDHYSGVRLQEYAFFVDIQQEILHIMATNYLEFHIAKINSWLSSVNQVYL